MNDPETTLDMDQAAEIGWKIDEMATRVLTMHKIVPGTRATWKLEMDDVIFLVAVTVESLGGEAD